MNLHVKIYTYEFEANIINQFVIEEAKKYAKSSAKSLSSIVGKYLGK